MKKSLKNNIFYFILGAVIFGGVSVYATYKLMAEEVSFIPGDKSWKVGSVKEALDSLYERSLSFDNCTTGKRQLTGDAFTEVGEKIFDFTPSMFFITYYDGLDASDDWNGGAYYNRLYADNLVAWIPLNANDSDYFRMDNLDSVFSIDNHLIIKNLGSTWKNKEIYYVVCK